MNPTPKQRCKKMSNKLPTEVGAIKIKYSSEPSKSTFSCGGKKKKGGKAEEDGKETNTRGIEYQGISATLGESERERDSGREFHAGRVADSKGPGV